MLYVLKANVRVFDSFAEQDLPKASLVEKEIYTFTFNALKIGWEYRKEKAKKTNVVCEKGHGQKSEIVS